jgi:hypothetical protein
MNTQELHIIDTALEVLMSTPLDMRDRRLKNAIYDCIRCFHGGEVWGEPYHIEMIDVNVATLSAILFERGVDT